MAFVVLLLAAFALSGALRFFISRTWLALLTPAALFVAFILLDAYVLPYRGGGASMWPIAIMFGGPVVLAGSTIGVLLAAQLRKRLAATDGAI